MFLLVDHHGELLGRFENEEQAFDSLAHAVDVEPEHAEDFGVVEVDDHGRRRAGPWVWRDGAVFEEHAHA